MNRIALFTLSVAGLVWLSSGGPTDPLTSCIDVAECVANGHSCPSGQTLICTAEGFTPGECDCEIDMGTGGTGGSGGTAGVPADCKNPVVLTADFDVEDPFTKSTVSVNGATDTATRETSGGSPDGFRKMDHMMPGHPEGSRLTVYHLFPQAYDPEDGAVTHINYSEDRIQIDPPFATAAIGTGFFVFQNETRFTRPLTEGVFTSQSWETAEEDKLTPEDFIEGLDFSTSGPPIQFGFYRSNSHNPSDVDSRTTHGIDNWRVEICRE